MRRWLWCGTAYGRPHLACNRSQGEKGGAETVQHVYSRDSAGDGGTGRAASWPALAAAAAREMTNANSHEERVGHEKTKPRFEE